jgi:ABC-type transport system substrate-binding protein
VSVAYDGLLAYRHTGGEAGATLVGDLAVAVPRPRDEGRTYAFRLRPGIRYSDGTPLRAADVRASLERLLSVQAGAVPNYFSALPGARECIRGVVPCDLSKAIEVDERARAVTFHLLRPDAELLPKLALPLAAILPADAPRHLAKGVPPPGTGPYRFASFDGHGGARLERNPHFTSWSADARPEGFADSISVTFTAPKAGGEAAAVEHGNADVAVLPAGAYDPGAHDRVRGLLASRTARLVPGRQLETEFMFLTGVTSPSWPGDPRSRIRLARSCLQGCPATGRSARGPWIQARPESGGHRTSCVPSASSRRRVRVGSGSWSGSAGSRAGSRATTSA